METQKSRRGIRLWWLVVIVGLGALVYFGPELVSLSCRDSVIALGSSMEPTIGNGQRLAIDPDAYLEADPERGDIALLKHGETQKLRNAKRIIGLPGETVTISGGGVFIDGVELEEPYLPDGTYTQSKVEELTVPEDHYFVLGDNRKDSIDSRQWGPIPRDWISAKVLL